MNMTGKEMMAREAQLLADLIAERDSLRKRVKDLEQQRTWVGLTEQEAADCWSTSAVQTWREIEAALKEKNT